MAWFSNKESKYTYLHVEWSHLGLCLVKVSFKSFFLRTLKKWREKLIVDMVK